LYEAIGDVENAANARYNIAQAKSKCGGGNSEKGGLKTLQELYELRIAQYGKEHAVTIEAGMLYALELQEANGWDEATELLTKLLPTSKRVLGPLHKSYYPQASEYSVLFTKSRRRFNRLLN